MCYDVLCYVMLCCKILSVIQTGGACKHQRYPIAHTNLTPLFPALYLYFCVLLASGRWLGGHPPIPNDPSLNCSANSSALAQSRRDPSNWQDCLPVLQQLHCLESTRVWVIITSYYRTVYSLFWIVKVESLCNTCWSTTMKSYLPPKDSPQCSYIRSINT